MGNIRIKIDEKSLFYGIYNDFSRGQTATVHTPINQSKDENKWHRDIIELLEADPGLSSRNLPETLIRKCLPKTTSQAESKIDNFYVFHNIYFDGVKLNTSVDFAFYIKEETSTTITNRHGILVPNTHLGRLKLHYPITLKFTTDGFNINNREVLSDILRQNGGFAFIVRGFDVNPKTGYINFLTSVVGEEGVRLSNVFMRAKGTGQKLLINSVDPSQLATFDESIIDEVGGMINVKTTPSGEIDFDTLNKTRVENGKMGEEYVFNHLQKILGHPIQDPYHTSREYPTSPYDIEYIDGGVKKYLEVKSTSGKKKVFNMSEGERKFMDTYDEHYILILLTDVRSTFPNIFQYHRSEIMKMNKSYPSIRFYA